MRINTEDKSMCCGCGACVHICPQLAITLICDEKGFSYPVIVDDKCINCGKCVTVCNFRKKLDVSKANKVYALRSNSKDVLQISSSGGAFTAFSDLILELKGSVFGSILGDDLRVYHKEAKTSLERNRMCGSKYVQSDLKMTFLQIRELLQKNSFVLFSGTPCQVNNLYGFLEKVYDNLYTIDFICHGTPSPKLFLDHINMLKSKYHKDIVDYHFRDKKYGWSSTQTVLFKDKKKNASITVQKNANLFYKNLSLRPSCYVCPYRNHKYSDITLGDFWGGDKLFNIYDNKGLSQVITHTSKGDYLLNQLKTSYWLKECSSEMFTKIKQNQIIQPSETNKFWELYCDKGYEAVIKKYSKYSVKQIISFNLRKIVFKLHIQNIAFKIQALIKKK
ncbi:MAG: hypothetical protein A2Y17_07375 [Clostridiales bacterium GWF2_38_85]|nr:MAG: hypothetical protein A2Y17_07375 [Clostridiales bacterium GWF2_38_85]